MQCCVFASGIIYNFARKSAPPNVTSKITLTNALVVKKAAFIRDRSP